MHNVSYKCYICKEDITSTLLHKCLKDQQKSDKTTDSRPRLFNCPICAKLIDYDPNSVHTCTPKSDDIEHPNHYTWHPVAECHEISRHFTSSLSKAIDYIWRCDYKGTKVKDLKKAIWYLNDEIKRSEGEERLKKYER